MHSKEKFLRTLILFFAGFHFGIMQSAIYFDVLVNVTATFMGYFLIISTWMLGVVYFLKFHKKQSFLFTLLLSIISYFAILFFTSIINTSIYLFIPMLPLVFLSASVVGEFFKEFSKQVPGRSLFFHENNGFIVGMIFSIILFTNFGINFLFVAPIVSYLLVYLIYNKKFATSFLFLSFLLLFLILSQHWLSTLVMGILLLCAITFYFIKINSTTEIQIIKNEKLFTISNNKKKAILFISGLNLIVLQYFIVREFSSILSANELSVMLVSAIYFLGFSIGYYLSKYIGLSKLKIISGTMLFIQIYLFVFIKVNAAQMISVGYSFGALFLLFFAVVFISSGFYSIFLPKFIEFTNANFIQNAYSWELFGAIIGVVLVYIVILFSFSFLLPLYFFLLLILIFMLLEKTKWAYSYFLIGIFVIGLFTINQNKIFQYSTEDYYKARGYDNPKVLFSKNSFYHSVEVIDTYFDKLQKVPNERISFLNGIKYFQYKYDLFKGFYQPTTLSEFTYYLAELPAKYLSNNLNRKLNVLILGGGSLYSLNRVAPYSEKTTLVEIDPIVVEAAKKCWTDFNKYDKLNNYQIIVDDAKHYLKASNESFDLIIMDISAPYYLGTALLHNEDFFSLVKTKLNKNGIFSESTQSRPNPKYPNSMAMKILKSVKNIFPKYRLIDSKNKNIGKHGFVFATTDLDVSTYKIIEIMKKDNRHFGTSTYWEGSTKFNLIGTVPISLKNMESLFAYSKDRIVNRLSLRNSNKPAKNFGELCRKSNLLIAIFNKIVLPSFYIKIISILFLALFLRFFKPCRKYLE